MKLSHYNKRAINQLRKNGVSWPQLSQQYGVNQSNLEYMVHLMDRHGVEVVRKVKNRRYSPELKQEIIDKILIHGCSQVSVSLDYALPNLGTLSNWLSQPIIMRELFFIVTKAGNTSTSLAIIS